MVAAAKVKFGIQTGLAGIEWSHLLDFWRMLDRETAFYSIWTFDHFVPPGPGQDPSETCLEGWTALAAAAQATERLRVGCLVTGNTYRHPAVLAKMAVTVDHISNGRLEFGLGAGWHEAEHTAYGIPFYTVRERQDRLDEAAALIRALFRAEGPVNFEGRYYQLQHAPFSPAFIQKPHPPIMIGGGGEKRTLRAAARYADMINVMGPLSAVRHKIEVLERHCADVGRDPNEIVKSVFVPVFPSENAEHIDRISQAVSVGFSVPKEQVQQEMPVGSPEHVRQIVEQYAELGVSYIIMVSQAPHNFDIYRYVSEQVVAHFQ
jgi:F420-dependent oxidoreductase-like protein